MAAAGDVVAVGANVLFTGNAYLFAGGATVATTTMGDPAPPGKNDFGQQILVLGKSVFVSALAADNGAGALYRYKLGATAPKSSVSGPLGGSGNFGLSVAGDGTNLVAGAPGYSGNMGYVDFTKT